GTCALRTAAGPPQGRVNTRRPATSRASGSAATHSVLPGLHGHAQRLGDGPRPPATNEGDPHVRFDQKLVRSQDLLLERDRGALHLLRRGYDLQHVVHARGLEELDLHRAYHEGKTRRLRARFFEQRAMTGAEKAQMIGAAALHETQISGVIDDAGKIG